MLKKTITNFEANKEISIAKIQYESEEKDLSRILKTILESNGDSSFLNKTNKKDFNMQ